MNYLDRLDSETVGEVIKELWLSSAHILAIGELVKNQNNDACYDNETLYGLGDLLCSLSERVGSAKDLLEYGKKGAADLSDDEERTCKKNSCPNS